jgi:hypothetical protein
VFEVTSPAIPQDDRRRTLVAHARIGFLRAASVTLEFLSLTRAIGERAQYLWQNIGNGSTSRSLWTFISMRVDSACEPWKHEGVVAPPRPTQPNDVTGELIASGSFRGLTRQVALPPKVSTHHR